MADLLVVRRNAYHDSARLMAISRRMQALPGIREAEVMMGTPLNLELLAGAGWPPAAATPLDLVVALRGERDDDLRAAEAALTGLLAGGETAATRQEQRPGSVAEAVALHPGANLVSIAVPGPYAAFVAQRALDAGRHVFLFSDNVPLADEIVLKRRGADLGLLVMGPDCGTAIISGVGLGFANRVRRGPVGIVGASGTGIQEICCHLDALGVGVSHAIGTGSRDLGAAVGGVMTELGLAVLAADPGTRAVVLVAKHPDPGVAARIHGVLAGLGKPAVVRYLGEEPPASRDGVRYAGSLDEAAEMAATACGQEASQGGLGSGVRGPGSGKESAGGVPAGGWGPGSGVRGPAQPPNQGRGESGEGRGPHPTRGTGRLVGLFGGGSLAAEARLALAQVGIDTTVPEEMLRVGAPIPGDGHIVVDTGDDAYTVGRPHPMVDQTVRCGLIRAAGADPTVGVVLLDLVLGDGAHSDPAPELADAVREARRARGTAPLEVVASVCGAAADPQQPVRQRAVLEEAGVRVEDSAFRAARLAAALLGPEGRA
ncbi:MAG: hypothetical protein MUF10_01200 [Thermoanaerobaculaceae bacterium]|nr:hypothetical protein [Thermoanaerobaculaceae bacterium]